MTARPRKAAVPPVPRESSVLRAVLELLRVRGILAWRANCGGMSGIHKGKRWFVRFGVSGQCDLTGILPGPGPRAGVRLEVEIKRPGEVPTPMQIRFMQAINAQSGIAVWVDNPTTLDLILDHVLAGATLEVADDAMITIIPKGANSYV